MPHERFQGTTTLGHRGDAIRELDGSVGDLLGALDRLGIAENTLVVFCSGNGPVLDDGYADGAIEKSGDHRAAGPFSGGKYSVYEGGTRIPFITRWPARIQPATSDEIVCTIDLAASLAALTGIPLEAESCLDSQDVLGALLGKAGSRGRSHLVQQNNLGNGVFGYRSGPWKLLRHDSQRATNTVVEGPLTTTRVPRLQLFRIDEDPAEKNNLFEQFPGEAERMNRELEGIIAAGRSRQGKSNVRVASQGTFSEINGPESAAPQQGAP